MGGIVLALIALLLGGCAEARSDSDSPADSAAAPDQAAARPADVATTGAYTFEIREGATRCTVAYAGKSGQGSVELSLSPPCRFVRSTDGGVQVASYRDAGETTVIIIAGTPTASDPASRPTAGLFCGTKSQAILIRDGAVLASQRVAEGRKCTTGEDAQEFWLFAH